MIRHPPKSPLFPYPTLFRSLTLLLLGAGLNVVADALAHVQLRKPLALKAHGLLEPLGDVQRREQLDLLLVRSEEHTSELQSLAYLVCRLLLEKKKNKYR